MGLTARKSLRLEDAELDKLYKNNKALWASMAKEAFDYTAQYVKKAKEPVRPDDLVSVLVSALEITQLLREFLANAGLRQQFWYEWFAEYIVDREWSALTQTGGQK
jgi:hypothetical protein